MKKTKTLLLFLAIACSVAQASAQALYDQIDSKALKSVNDEKGNIIPDFSRVGYHFGDTEIPTVKVVAKVSAPKNGEDATQLIQDAIDKVAKLPLRKRGAILLEKGLYNIANTIVIKDSGIVLRGEANNENPALGTVLVATDTTKQYSVIQVSDSIKISGNIPTKMNVKDSYVPLGRFWVTVDNAKDFKVKDNVILMTNNNQKWISDIKMDQITPRPGRPEATRQWTVEEYKLKARRVITKIDGDTLWFENPVTQTIEAQYGGAAVYKYKYSFDIISEVGIENMFIKSDYAHDTHENHGWRAIQVLGAEHGWIRNVDAKHFGYALAHLDEGSKNFTVVDCTSSDDKSKITGGRRYAFYIKSELSLVMNCKAYDSRHSFICSPYNCGPNVFVNCTAERTHADIGPHERWNTATLYDNVTTGGQINIQDRGFYGSGHGWAGANNVLWNCEGGTICVQNIWGNVARNFSIGTIGKKLLEAGVCKGRPDGTWVSHGKHVSPQSLYHSQLEYRHSLQKNVFDVK